MFFIKYFDRVINSIFFVVIVASYFLLPLKEFVLVVALVFYVIHVLRVWSEGIYVTSFNEIAFDIYYFKIKLRDKDLFSFEDYDEEYKKWYNSLSKYGKAAIDSQNHSGKVK